MHRELERVLKPGDVVLEKWDVPWWRVSYHVGAAGIRYCQRRWLGDDCLWTHNHAMLYFDPKCALDFVLPVVRWRPTIAYYGSVSVWRYAGRALSDADTAVMRKSAEGFIGHPYNVPMFLLMALHGRMGTRQVLEWMIRAMPRFAVCSVGVRLAMESAVCGASGSAGLFTGVPLVGTTPAHYSLGPERGSSFEEVVRFESGKRVDIGGGARRTLSPRSCTTTRS